MMSSIRLVQPGFTAGHLALGAGGDTGLEQACEQIVDAGLAGARWVIFPEGSLPGYPAWVWTLYSGADPLLDALRAEVLVNAVPIPSGITDRLCSIAQRAQVNVAIGVIERDDTAGDVSYYNALLLITARGRLVGRYRSPCAIAGVWSEWIPVAAPQPADETPGLSRVGGI